MTAVPSLLLSDIYPKHIKQIKKRKETISSGLWTLSLAFVLCSHVFPFFSPLSCLCDWLTCLFEEILNVCLHSETHRHTNTRWICSDAHTHRDNELAERRRKRRIKTDWLISRGHLLLTLPWLSSLFSGALKWTVIRLWYSGKWTVIRVCYCGSSAWAAHWIFTPLLNVKISLPLSCTNSVAWQRPFADGVRGMVEAVCVRRQVAQAWRTLRGDFLVIRSLPDHGPIIKKTVSQGKVAMWLAEKDKIRWGVWIFLEAALIC